MTQQLVWNFEFSAKKPLSLTNFVAEEQDSLKWEARFFWPENHLIRLCPMNGSLLKLANYQSKHKEDNYYLLAHCDYNIKRRRDELVYKPLLKQSAHAFGFGTKLNLGDLANISNYPQDYILHLQRIADQALKHGVEVLVKKESFIYKFSTTPSIKLELARLEVNDTIYFSACIEGKSLYLVETICEHLLGKQVSSDYVTFLKDIIKL